MSNELERLRAALSQAERERDEARALLRDIAGRLMRAPGLPLEVAVECDLAQWTDTIAGILIQLTDYIPLGDAALAASQDAALGAAHEDGA